MSARVVKPISLLEVSRLRAGAAASAALDRRPCGKGVLKARRALFGPVDHVQTQRFVEEELARQATSDRERWNFDFVHGLPLGKGLYEWRVINMNPNAARPTAPTKRRTEDEDFFDIADLYCEPTQFVGRASDEDEQMIMDETTPVKETAKKQRLITGKLYTLL